VKPGIQRVLTHWNQGFMPFRGRGAPRTVALKVKAALASARGRQPLDLRTVPAHEADRARPRQLDKGAA